MPATTEMSISSHLRLPDDTLQPMHDAYDRLLANNPDIESDIMLGPHLENPGAQGVKGSREWLEFATQPELLDIAEQLAGEDLILWRWIALDVVTPENGPMRFMPGSHKQRKIYSHHREENDDLSINLVCDSQHFNESTARDLLFQAGQVSFHDVYMIHGSNANHTDQRRAVFVVRIMPGTCHYDHAPGEEMGATYQAHDYG